MNNVISFKAKKSEKKHGVKNPKTKSVLEKKYAHQISAMKQNCKDKEILETFEENPDKTLEVFKMQEEITQSIYDFIGDEVEPEKIMMVIGLLFNMAKGITENGKNIFGEEFEKKALMWLTENFGNKS